MSRFASRENSLTEQRVIGRELEALLGAVEVTGLSGWERAKNVYGRSSAGLAEGDVVRPTQETSGERVAHVGAVHRSGQPTPSASPVQTPLFEEAA